MKKQRMLLKKNNNTNPESMERESADAGSLLCGLPRANAGCVSADVSGKGVSADRPLCLLWYKGKYAILRGETEEMKIMYIIVGLGNPGREYAHTRHNVGFDTIDILADRYGIDVTARKHKALVGKGMIEGAKVILAKPQTYMNLSGESVRELLDFYKIDETQELIVIYDDISLDPGQLRIRLKGSAGGHNGIKSIISHLGGQEFPRIRIGVGEKPAGYDLADYVLGHFPKEEAEEMELAKKRAASAAAMMVSGDTQGAMNEFNQKK